MSNSTHNNLVGVKITQKQKCEKCLFFKKKKFCVNVCNWILRILKDGAFIIFITSATMDPPSVPWLISYLQAPTAPSPAETVEIKPFPLLPDSLLRLPSTFLVFH